MNTRYDIMDAKDEQFLDSFIPLKAKALWRKQYPEAYLVKVVRTRCREPRLKKGS